MKNDSYSGKLESHSEWDRLVPTEATHGVGGLGTLWTIFDILGLLYRTCPYLICGAISL